MRVVAVKTLKNFWEKESLAEQALKSWYEEAEKATWKSPQELKQQYVNASILSNKRVIFNIHGNKYRLIVDIEYRLQIVFIVWIGTHDEYDKIDAKNINYVKIN
ncbi:MAG: type II toxin-antitoxin system HigB family toxin [Spirosomaceae bacterium]|jgi:mRNA interferase HigB|nr:type II toxin-antitoxin system HigB family toxin [Spirosomataceae bacterium]